MGSDRPIRYQRLTPFAPTISELQDFVGKYRSPELDVPYFLAVENDQLMLHTGPRSHHSFFCRSPRICS